MFWEGTEQENTSRMVSSDSSDMLVMKISLQNTDAQWLRITNCQEYTSSQKTSSFRVGPRVQ